MAEFAATEGIEPYDSYSRMEPFSPTEAAIDRDLRLRIRDFYRTSDNKALNERWLEFFTPGARGKIGAQEAESHESTSRCAGLFLLRRKLTDTRPPATAGGDVEFCLGEEALGHTCDRIGRRTGCARYVEGRRKAQGAGWS